MSLQSPSFSVILPVYQEQAVLAATVEALGAALAGLAERYEVIVVDDGSSDRTFEVLRHLAYVNSRAASAQIDIEEDGTVNVFAADGDSMDIAVREVEMITAEIEEGKIYEGTVSGVKDFGKVFDEVEDHGDRDRTDGTGPYGPHPDPSRVAPPAALEAPSVKLLGR